MTALDFFYNKFIDFCNENDLVDNYNKGLSTSRKYSSRKITDKKFILSIFSDDLFSISFCWDATPQGYNYWMSVHEKWSNYYQNKLVKEFSVIAKSLDPVIFYYYDQPFNSYMGFIPNKIVDLYKDGCNVIPIHQYNANIVFTCKKLPKHKFFVYIVTHLNECIFSIIAHSEVSINFVKLDLNKDVIRISSNFADLIENFPAVVDTIFEIGFPIKINYLDIDLSTGKVSYLPIEKTRREDFDQTEAYINSNRKITTIGRLLNKFNRELYLTKSDIEKISNYLSGFKSDFDVQIWDSSRIKEAYLKDNYSKQPVTFTSTLHKSCMRYSECQEYLTFYEKAKVKIAVAIDKKGKVCARALLWKINNSLYFLDRIYSVSPFINVKFAKRVIEKVPIDFYKIDKVVYNAKTHTAGELPSYRIHRKALIGYNGLFPYADTFEIFDASCGNLLVNNSIFRLHSTNGEPLKLV